MTTETVEKSWFLEAIERIDGGLLPFEETEELETTEEEND